MPKAQGKFDFSVHHPFKHDSLLAFPDMVTVYLQNYFANFYSCFVRCHLGYFFVCVWVCVFHILQNVTVSNTYMLARICITLWLLNSKDASFPFLRMNEGDALLSEFRIGLAS